MFDGTQEGGFGMYIISQSMDEVRYYRDEAGPELHFDDQKAARSRPEEESVHGTDDGEDR